jgi:hypothetical protein
MIVAKGRRLTKLTNNQCLNDATQTAEYTAVCMHTMLFYLASGCLAFTLGSRDTT